MRWGFEDAANAAHHATQVWGFGHAALSSPAEFMLDSFGMSMNRMASVFLIVASSGCSSRYFNPATLPIPPESPLQDVLARDSTPVGRLSEIPTAVTAVILDGLHYDPRIADANEAWEATDVIMSDAPHRRFVAGAHFGNGWALLYEHGGPGYDQHQHLVIVEQDDGAPAVIYWGTGHACKPRQTRCSAGEVDLAGLKAATAAGWFGANELTSNGCR